MAVCTLPRQDGKNLFYPNLTLPGQSGGPVFYTEDDIVRVIGIHKGSMKKGSKTKGDNEQLNYCCLINREMISELKGWAEKKFDISFPPTRVKKT